MIIPEAPKSIQYKYTSPMISLNLALSISFLEPGCKLLTLEAPFMGKHFAIIQEDEENISLIKFGKGLFYGSLGYSDLASPVFKMSKHQLYNEDITVKGKYIVKMYPEFYTFKGENVKFENCRVLSFTHDKGYYYIYLREEEGVVAVQNYTGNVIRETIVKREA
jgi:hypothetical protein